MGTGSFPGVKSGRGVKLTPHPLLVPCSRNSRAISLIPLWAVRPVQSLSACTGMHFTLLFTIYQKRPSVTGITCHTAFYRSVLSTFSFVRYEITRVYNACWKVGVHVVQGHCGFRYSHFIYWQFTGTETIFFSNFVRGLKLKINWRLGSRLCMRLQVRKHVSRWTS